MQHNCYIWCKYGVIGKYKDFIEDKDAYKNFYESLSTNYHILKEFTLMHQTIGNFTLIPNKAHFPDGKLKHFNKHRGIDANIKDFWDRSFELLSDDNNLGYDAFVDYIDAFYLHDFIDDSYRPVPLFAGSLCKDDNGKYINIMPKYDNDKGVDRLTSFSKTQPKK